MASSTLSVLTWNLLAPPFFRVPADLQDDLNDPPLLSSSSTSPDGWPSATLKTGCRRVLESHYPLARRARLAQELVCIQEVAADLVALQELWFASECLDALASALGAAYHVVGAQRPSGKPDGVALLAKRSTFDLLAEHRVNWPAPHNRCAALALLRLRERGDGGEGKGEGAAASAAAPSGRCLIAVSTHLTFPDCEEDRTRRVEQAFMLVEEVRSFARRVGVTAAAPASGGSEGSASSPFAPVPVILSGDMNAADDNAVRAILSAGYASSFRTVHGRDPIFSHLDHNCTGVGVDAVFVHDGVGAGECGEGGVAAADDAAPLLRPRLRLRPLSASLLPAGVPDDTPMTRPVPQVKGERDEPPPSPAAAAALFSPGSDEGREAQCMRCAQVVRPTGCGCAADGGGPAEVEVGSAPAQAPAPAPAFATLRTLSALSLADFCLMSDHRPLRVVLEVGE
jgi:endonuclease/exonuclease/phosphatase family metal-dependent hydrolase